MRVEERAVTRVVLPAPWTPLRPIMKGEDEALDLDSGGWVLRRERMKGMQWGDLSSIIVGLEVDIWKDSQCLAGSKWN